MANISNRDELPDLQNTGDVRGKKIERAGVEHVMIPLKVHRKDPTDGLTGEVQADVSMFVEIEEKFKGANMSRFMETLMMFQSQSLSSNSIEEILEQMMNRLDSEDGYIKILFKYPIIRFAPVSKGRSVQYYDIAFIGRRIQSKNGPGCYNFVMEINVIGTNLCPCSKEISQYGAHNQRNHIRVRLVPNQTLWWIEDIVAVIENQLSCPIFPLLKREDEKWVTETAYENPKFVEDTVRDVALALDKYKIDKYEIRSQADESIHHHQAVAVLKHNWKNVPE